MAWNTECTWTTERGLLAQVMRWTGPDSTYRCGYVEVPANHDLAGVADCTEYPFAEVEITFAGWRSAAGGKHWMIGFDRMSHSLPPEEKTLGYCVAECERIAAVLSR